MVAKSIKKTREVTGDQQVDRAIQVVQDDVDESLQTILQGVLVNARELRGVTISALSTPVDVEHKLGRDYIHWWPTSITTDARISEVVPQPSKNSIIRIQALSGTVPVTFNLIVV